jgi:ADP-heptose:LPS heptosyltransferase
MQPTSRVIIYRLGSLGDTVAALPCFHLIEQAFPDRERLVLTNVPVSSKAAPLEIILKDGGFIHGSIAYPLGLRDPVGLCRLARQLRQLQADTLVYLAESRGLSTTWRDIAYFRLCGFKNIIGAPTTPDLQRNRIDAMGELERESFRLGRTLKELGHIDFDDRAWWDLRLTETEQMAGATALGPAADRPFVAVNTGGKVVKKDWGEANWIGLLRILAARIDGYGLVFVGAREDSERAARLGSIWGIGPVVDLCGRLTPRESAAALAHADLFIGHDSGPLHLADAVGVSCIGLYGSYNRPRLWHPSGPKTKIIHHMEGLETITPGQVVEAALLMLDARNGAMSYASDSPSS